MARRTARSRSRRSSRPESSVSIADLLQPCELAALERMLDGDDAELRARLGRLLDDHGLDPNALEVEVAGGRVRLSGAVADPLTSLLVEDLAWSMPQVVQCDNRLQIRDDGAHSWSIAS
jgi:BON domain